MQEELSADFNRWVGWYGRVWSLTNPGPMIRELKRLKTTLWIASRSWWVTRCHHSRWRAGDSYCIPHQQLGLHILDLLKLFSTLPKCFMSPISSKLCSCQPLPGSIAPAGFVHRFLCTCRVVSPWFAFSISVVFNWRLLCAGNDFPSAKRAYHSAREPLCCAADLPQIALPPSMSAQKPRHKAWWFNWIRKW